MVEVGVAGKWEGQLQLFFPDGTQVWLNSGIKQSYPESFEAGERRVQLSRVAFFEVGKDPLNPLLWQQLKRH